MTKNELTKRDGVTLGTTTTNSLFNVFNNWYAFPAGPVEYDIYR